MKKERHQKSILFDNSPNMSNCVYNDIESVIFSKFKIAVENFKRTVKSPKLLGSLQGGIDRERMLKVKREWEKNYGKEKSYERTN